MENNNGMIANEKNNLQRTLLHLGILSLRIFNTVVHVIQIWIESHNVVTDCLSTLLLFLSISNVVFVTVDLVECYMG